MVAVLVGSEVERLIALMTAVLRCGRMILFEVCSCKILTGCLMETPLGWSRTCTGARVNPLSA